MEAIHEEAENMFKVGAINKERMKEYDDACFVKPSKKTSKPLKARTVALKRKTVTRKHVKAAHN